MHVRTHNQPFVSLVAIALLTFTACSDDGVGAIDSGPITDDAGRTLDDAGNPITDAQQQQPDATVPTGCVAEGTQCNNCVDDDTDGAIDGFDVHCISAEDDDESSFATGISGDNMDATWQDCFFDGNSGAGDDKCKYHTCCLLAGACPDGNFDPVDDCEVTAECAENCAPSAPPGCDCFGCCTICNDANECSTVVTNPAIAPDCDVDASGTPVNCPACNPSVECGTPCEPTGCVLCPGQTEDDLPPGCNGAECPDGLSTCVSNEDCTGSDFCSNGCCIPQIG